MGPDTASVDVDFHPIFAVKKVGRFGADLLRSAEDLRVADEGIIEGKNLLVHEVAEFWW